MTRNQLEAAAQRGRGRRTVVLAGALLAGLSTLGVAGRGFDPPPPPPGGSGDGGGMMDEEAIGSLPVQFDGGHFLLLPGLPHPWLPPSFYLEGPTQRLLDAVVAAQGNGVLGLHPTEDPDRSRIVVHGPLWIDLDASVLADPEIEVGLVSGAAFGPIAAGTFHQGSLVRRDRLDAVTHRLDLPVGRLYELGFLESGIDLVTRGPRADQLVHLHAQGGVVSLVQLN